LFLKVEEKKRKEKREFIGIVHSKGGKVDFDLGSVSRLTGGGRLARGSEKGGGDFKKKEGKTSR